MNQPTIFATGVSTFSRRSPHPTTGALTASLVFARRSVLKIRHVPEQLGDILGIPVLFTLMFTYLFGGAIAGSTHHYLQYLLPGTLALAVIFVTVYSGVTLNTDLATGAFDRFRSLPVWRPAPIVGGLIGDLGRYLIASLLVIGMGFAMGFHAAGGALGVVAGVALVLIFAFAISWVWTTLGLILRTPNAVMSIGFVILFPLTFMSNIFVDPRTMPTWLHTIARDNPVSHLAVAERGLLQGTATAAQILWVAAAATILTLIFAPLTVRLYRNRT